MAVTHAQSAVTPAPWSLHTATHESTVAVLDEADLKVQSDEIKLSGHKTMEGVMRNKTVKSTIFSQA